MASSAFTVILSCSNGPGDGALVPLSARFACGRVPMLRAVLRRQAALFKRDPTLTRARIAQCIIIGLIIGGLWFQLDVNAESARCGHLNPLWLRIIKF
jgi:hypothetical protein